MRNSRPDPEVSVDLARLTTPGETLSSAPRAGFGLGRLAASLPRSLGLRVRHDTLPDNPAHALILGNDSIETGRRLARSTEVVVHPRPRA